MEQLSPYKRSEKRWKRVDGAAIRSDASLLDTRSLSTVAAPELQRLGVRRAATWRSKTVERPVFAFDGLDERLHGGFFVIPGALDAKEQLKLALACLYVSCLPDDQLPDESC